MRLVVSGLFSPESLYRHATTMLEAGATSGEPNAWVCHACQVAGRLICGVNESADVLHPSS